MFFNTMTKGVKHQQSQPNCTKSQCFSKAVICYVNNKKVPVGDTLDKA